MEGFRMASATLDAKKPMGRVEILAETKIPNLDKTINFYRQGVHFATSSDDGKMLFIYDDPKQAFDMYMILCKTSLEGYVAGRYKEIKETLSKCHNVGTQP